MTSPALNPTVSDIKKPKGLSSRISWLRDYYFKGNDRAWNNEYTAWSTGTPWDIQFNEMTFYIVPETYLLMQTMVGSYRQAARTVALDKNFWSWSLPERRAWFVKETMVNYVPREILPGDLIAGARFNVQTSLCLNRKEQKQYDQLTVGKKGARAKMKRFHDHGYGNSGATSGHLIPGHERALQIGWKGIHADLSHRYDQLKPTEKKGAKGAQLRAMITAATLLRDFSARYADLCRNLAKLEPKDMRHEELLQMARNLDKVPWEPPTTFWEAVQALWINCIPASRVAAKVDLVALEIHLIVGDGS